MSFLWKILDAPFVQLRPEQQLLIVLVLFCCVALTIYAVVLAVRRIRPARLHERRIVSRPVLISWRDGVGLRQSDGFCQDVSTGGMSLELPFPLKVRTRLKVQMSEANLSRVGVVRRCTCVGPGYVVGVEFDRLTRAFVNS